MWLFWSVLLLVRASPSELAMVSKLGDSGNHSRWEAAVPVMVVEVVQENWAQVKEMVRVKRRLECFEGSSRRAFVGRRGC